MFETPENLRRAARLVRAGWIQGDHHRINPPFDAAAAIAAACTGHAAAQYDVRVTVALDALAMVVDPKHTAPSLRAVNRWNDEREQTAENVAAAIEQAADRVERLLTE